MMWFKKKVTKEQLGGHDLDELDREHSSSLRKARNELKRIQIEQEKARAEIELEKARLELEGARYDLEQQRRELYEDDDDEQPLKDMDFNNPDAMMMMLLSQVLNKGGGGSANSYQAPLYAPPPPPPTPTPQAAQPTDEDLRKMKSELPNIYLQQAKNAAEEDLKKIIKSNFPEWNEETTQKAIRILRE